LGNSFRGIIIKEGGDPVVQNCSIQQNAYEAVKIYDGGKGTIEDCYLRNNTKGSWNIESGSQVRRRGNSED